MRIRIQNGSQLTAFSLSFNAFHSLAISFVRSWTAMFLKSSLARRLTKNCTYELIGLFAARSSWTAGHNDEKPLRTGSFLRRLARALFATLISWTVCDSTHFLYSAWESVLVVCACERREHGQFHSIDKDVLDNLTRWLKCSTSAGVSSLYAAATALLCSASLFFTSSLGPLPFKSLPLSFIYIVYALVLARWGGRRAAFFRSRTLRRSSFCVFAASCSTVNSFFGFAAGFFFATVFFPAATFFLASTFRLAGDSSEVLALAAVRLAARFTGREGSPTTLRGLPRGLAGVA